MPAVEPYGLRIGASHLDDVTAEQSPTPDSRARHERRRRVAVHRRRRGLIRLAILIAVIGLVSVFITQPGGGSPSRDTDPGQTSPIQPQVKFAVPGLLNPHDVYAADRPGELAPAVRNFPSRVYVPNSESNTVSVIDPRSYRVIDEFRVGANPQHVVPSYDLKTLWVNNDQGNSLTAINPATGKPGRTVPVTDPYNLYFTPDGRYAIVVSERRARLDFRDAQTMGLHRSLAVPCSGVNHMDFTADGRYLLASCEFDGKLVKVDVQQEKVIKTTTLRADAMPQDVKLSPDGRDFYVADMASNGVWVVDAKTLREIKFIPTGMGAHGLYVSRDSRFLYVSNRMEGSVSVISFSTLSVAHKWRIPGGGSPDMGGVSADGKVLWLSGRYDGVVYAISTQDGKLHAKIPVGSGPHGLCVYPQPGRYSLGHTGVFR